VGRRGGLYTVQCTACCIDKQMELCERKAGDEDVGVAGKEDGQAVKLEIWGDENIN
jgi:hypothetical protein